MAIRMYGKESAKQEKILLNQEGKTNNEIKTLLKINHKKARRKIVCSNNEEKQNIGLKPGGRCINIASLNYDDLRSEQRINELLTRLEIQKIDIACIQETHNTTLDVYENHNYCIQFSKATTSGNNNKGSNKNGDKKQDKGIGGVAIAYRKTLANIITDIQKNIASGNAYLAKNKFKM